MNRKQLLALARKQGYTGPADLAKIKAFLADELIELADTEGKAIDIDAAWAKKAVVGAEVEGDPGDEDDGETKTKAIEITEEQAEDYKRLKRAEVAAARGKGNPHKGLVDDDAPGGDFQAKRFAIINNADKKAYKAKIAAGTAKMPDADMAENFGAWARLAIARVNKDVDYSQKSRDMEIVGKTALTSVNTAAGFLIPDEYISSLLYLTEQYGVARKLANVRRMSRDVQMQPRKTAIVAMQHTGEATATTAQDNTYGMVELIAKKVQATSQMSNELLEDSAISAADDLASSVAEAYAIRMDQDYFLGDGTSTYGGHTGLISALPSGAYISGSGNAWTAITLGDVDNQPGYVENVSIARCAYVSSRQFFYRRMKSLDKAAQQFKDRVGGPMGGAEASLDGFPWFFSQVLPTASASASKFLYFGDFQAGSMIGERRDLAIASSEHVGFTSDVMTFRATARYAINIHGDGRGSTYGPIVNLKTT